MKRQRPTIKIQDNTKRLARLARALFEVARHTDDRGQLELIKEAAGAFESVTDEFVSVLHPDLGFNISEYIAYRLDGEAHIGDAEDYERLTDEMLKEAEEWLALHDTRHDSSNTGNP